MKILLAILLFATCAYAQGGMGPGPGVKGYAGGGGCSPGVDIGNGWCQIAHAKAGSVNTTSVTTGAIDTTGADLIVVVVHNYTGSGTIATADISDSKSNSWTEGKLKDVSGVETLMAFSKPTSVGSGHTFSAGNASVTFPAITVYAVSGSHASPLDQTNGGDTGGSATSMTTNSITPTQNAELIVSGWTTGGTQGSTPTINSGFTIGDFQDGVAANSMTGALAYVTQTTAAAINPLWAWTLSTNATAVIVSFKHA